MRRSSSLARIVTAVFLAGFLFGMFSARGFSWNPPDESNVNSRYTVESVELSGAQESKLSRSLREELNRYVGQRFSPEVFARLSTRVREELRARFVSPKLMRGSSPDSVKVVLDVRGKSITVNMANSRIGWHATNGWTGDLTVNVFERRGQRLSAGVFSDGETSTERIAGVKADYSTALLDGRIRPGFALSTTHAQYDPRTRAAATPGDLYRSVDTYQPSLTLVALRREREELTIESGLRFQRFTLESPVRNPEAASHALVNTLRYQRVSGDIDSGRTTINAAYTVTNGLAALNSDYAFDRQEAHGGVEYRHDAHRLSIDLIAGRLNGMAPFRDRFAAGNSMVLRGWNKLDIAPLGAGRLIASTVEYGHNIKGRLEAAAFVDGGALWNRNASAPVRTSAGCGLRTRDGFYFFIAFPLRDGRFEPMLMTGATF